MGGSKLGEDKSEIQYSWCEKVGVTKVKVGTR